MNDKAPAPAASAGGSRASTKKELPEHLKSYKHVWVLVELERGVVHPVSWELMGEGRKLADKLKVDLCGVVLGPPGGTDKAVADCFGFGADVVYVTEHPVLSDYRNEPYTNVATELVNKYQPEILLLGATNLGRDLAGSVATTLLTGLTADCTELEVDADGSLAATRPTFGGSLLCTIYTLNYRPQMATMRPRVAAVPVYVPGRSGKVIRHEVSLPEDDIVTKILAFLPDATSNKSKSFLCGYRRRRRSRHAERRELPADPSSRGRAWRRMGRLASARAKGLDRLRSADRPDRQDDPAAALHSRRHFGRDSASCRC